MDASEEMAGVMAVMEHAREVWSVVLDCLEGLVRQATDVGWPDSLARQMVATQWMAGMGHMHGQG